MSRNPGAPVRALLAALLVACTLVVFAGGPAAATPGAGPAQASSPSPALTASPSASTLPLAPPPGERNPLQGVLAVVAIIVAGGAGVFIYRVIRKGL